jgi:AmmeMemoRadiSam system protein B
MNRSKYLCNKKNYTKLKATLNGGVFSSDFILDLNTHTKRFFIDIDFEPTFKFGNKNSDRLILPHAGTKIIRSIFEHVFSNIRRDFKRIILLSTNHSNRKNYQSSFKSILKPKINLETIDGIDIDNKEFLVEHSFLSVLPFIAKFNLPTSIVVIGNHRKDLDLIKNTLERIGDTVGTEKMSDTLLIANTDLLHCGKNFDSICPSIDEYNEKTIENILNMQTDFEIESMCGSNCIKMFLSLINNTKGTNTKNTNTNNTNTNNTKFTHTYFDTIYSSSDKILRDKDSSVGYVGITYMKNGKDHNTNQDNYQHNQDNYQDILKLPKMIISDKILERYFGQRLSTSDKLKIIDQFKSDHKINYFIQINNVNGIFVTIMKNGKLAGCIGTFNLIGDIINTVLDRTLETAFNDTRFEPLNIEDVRSNVLTYKINFLKKPFVIGNKISDIVSTMNIGTHGITIHFGDGSAATYLPSVMRDLGITQRNLHQTVNELIKSLAKKSGTRDMSSIKKIELYEGIEFEDMS